MEFTPNKFIYNEETRVHTFGKQIIPSVTQIIAPLCDYSRIPPKTLERKRQLGIHFHDAIFLRLQNNLDDSSLHPDIVKSMKAFDAFLADQLTTDRCLNIEAPMIHPNLKYCGKPDLVADQRGTSVIYDWKLRSYNKITDPLQMAAYKELYTNVTDLIVVCFDLDGNYKVHHAFNIQAWPVFRKMLDRWKSEQKFNLLLNKWKEAQK